MLRSRAGAKNPGLPVPVGRWTGWNFRTRWEVFPGRFRSTALHAPVACRHSPLNIRAAPTAPIPRPPAARWCAKPWPPDPNNMAMAEEVAAADVEERLTAVRGEVDRACYLLLAPSPESLDRCARLLETAGRRLAEVRPDLRGGRPAARTEAHRLRSSVRHAAQLLEAASSFHLNCNRLRGVLTFGYTERGDREPVPGVSRISLSG